MNKDAGNVCNSAPVLCLSVWSSSQHLILWPGAMPICPCLLAVYDFGCQSDIWCRKFLSKIF